jgi:hypothetical protein
VVHSYYHMDVKFMSFFTLSSSLQPPPSLPTPSGREVSRRKLPGVSRGARDFFFFLEIAHWGPTSSYLMALPFSVKRLGCDADISSASGIEVKNECSHGWLHTATSSWCVERQLDYRSQRIRRVFVDVRNDSFVVDGWQSLSFYALEALEQFIIRYLRTT